MDNSLQPFKSGEEAEMGRKGGLVRSERKRYAARLRELKKKGASNQAIREIVNILEDSESSAVNILLLLEEVKTAVQGRPQQMLQLAQAYLAWHKVWHQKVNETMTEEAAELKLISEMGRIIQQVNEEMKAKQRETQLEH